MPVTRREQKEKLEEGKDPSVVIAKNIGDTREKCCEVKWYPLNSKKQAKTKYLVKRKRCHSRIKINPMSYLS